MTELARPRGRRSRAARIFRRLQNSGRAPGGTAPDAHDRHDAARSDGGDLSRDAARADDLGLGALSRRLRGSRHGGGLRRLVRRGRAFSPSPRAADSPYRRRAGEQAAHRRGDGALHHQQLPLPPRRHRAARVGRLCRSRGAMARGRAQRAGGRVRRRTRHSRTRSTSCRKRQIDEWVAFAARRGIEAVPAAPLASRGLSILWARGAGQTLLDQGLDFVETTLERTRRRSSGTWRKKPGAGSPNGSTT